MKKFQLLLAALLTLAAVPLFAQTPVNDDCVTPIDLGVVPSCEPVVYTNVGATNSNIGSDNNPACFNGGIATRDVWFSFTTPSNLVDFRITLTGTGIPGGLVNPQFAIYRGDCEPDGLAEYACVKADVGETELFIDLEGLTPDFTYYIRVSDFSLSATPNSGTFTLCVDEIPPVFTIDEGGSTACSGVLADTGGPDGDYGANELFTYTICPSQPSSCIEFVLDYYNIDAGPTFGPGADVLAFYDGPNAFSPPITAINGNGFSDPDGGGGVCFQVKATSGCLTIEFTSDGTLEFEGFLGHWQCSTTPCPQPGEIFVNTPIQPQDIVNAVQTAATTVTITDIVCEGEAYGTFSYPTATNDLQMAKGLVLTSGSAFFTAQPGQNFASTLYFSPGDADLDFLSTQQGGQESNDACVVEMDVFVATNELSFEYVFGSEEYPEFVNSPGGFNDIFAFLVSGPGIVGDPGLGGQKNIAVLPGGTTAVEINSVNNLVNWQYYRNNENGQEIVYDGLTSDYLGIKKSLTATTQVIPCNTYHLKLAVADRGDAAFDSGVFVAEIKGGTPDIAVAFASGIDYFIEDCSGTGDSLIISISEPQDEIVTFTTTIGGTATLGVDYQLNLPGVITLLPGQTTVKFPIFPITDALVEGTETITVTLSNNFGCGTVVYKVLTLEIKDNVEVNVNAGADTLLVCANQPFQLQAQGATAYFWQPVNAVSNPNIDDPTITTTTSQWIFVTGTIASCVDVDSVYIQVVDPSLNLQALADTNICVGSSVALLANNNVNNSNLTWSPTDGLSDPGSNATAAAPTATTTYIATVNVAGCLASDAITINVDTLFFPILANDTTACQNYPVKLATDVISTTQYSWAPVAGLDDPTVSGPLATPDVNTTYTLLATSANGYCTRSESVVVNVIAADVDISGDTYREICLGTTVDLTATAAPVSPTQVTWTPSFFVTNPTGLTTSATPDESVTIKATYSINGCTVVDSIRLRVDSLPNQALSLRPDKSIYCPGDTVTLLSPTYEPASFPDIQIYWQPDGLGQITPDSFWNLVIRAQVTDTFSRVIINRGCRDTSSIEVPVGVIPEIMVSATPQQICPGQVVQLLATVEPSQALEWGMAEPPLSCTECPNPTASPQSTTTYSVSTPDADCPASAEIEIVVNQLPQLGLQDLTICGGETVTLNNAPAEPNVTYAWTSNPTGFTSSEAQPSVQVNSTTTYTVAAANPACSVQQTVTITVPVVTLEIGPDQNICGGESITLTAAVTGAQGTFNWDNNQITQAINVSPQATTTYSVVFSYNNGECTATDAVNVTVNSVSLGSITIDPTGDVCEGAPVALSVSSFSTQPLLFTWTQNGQQLPGILADSFTVRLNSNNGDAQTYSFAVTGVDAAGCSASAGPVSVTVLRCFKIPNAFSPDGDQINDVFRLVLLNETDVTVSSFSIYNRWGQRVYSSTTNPSWDGQVDGQPAPVDTYIYQIDVRNADGTIEHFSGDITLLR